MGVEDYKITQISVFIENKKGRFFNVTKTLKDASVNIRAMSLADTMDFGILRFVVDKPKDAYDALLESDFIVKKNYVLAISVKDESGGLSELLDIISRLDLNIEYMYTFVNALENTAVMLFKFEDIEEAIEKLLESNVELLKEEFFRKV